MKITKQNGEISFTFPESMPRYNPYHHPDDQHGEYPTFTGLIYTEYGNDEFAFAATIDMDYKGKEDQVGNPIVHFWGNEKEFREKCEELGINIYDMREI